MTRKIITLCSIVIAFSLCFAVFSVGCKDEKNNITTASLQTLGAVKSETTAGNVIGGVINGLASYAPSGSADGSLDKIEAASDKVDGVLGGVGDMLGGISSGSSGDVGGGISDALGSIDTSALGGIGDALGGIDTGALGNVGSGLGDVGSGLGDAISGMGSGALSGIGGGLSGIFGGAFGGSTTTTVASTINTTQNYDAGLIIPVPAATQITTENIATETQAAPNDESETAGETVDYAATSNPYTKPTATFVAGDEDESIKWLQWIFIYIGYGLKDDGITGVLDEDTVAVVKKLQKGNGLTVDGNITEDVIKVAEELYYKVALGGDVNAIEVVSQVTTGVNGSDGTTTTGEDSNVPVIVLVVILVVIWTLAIGGIVVLFVLKKKKAAPSKVEQAKPEEKNDAPQTESKETVSSISDLFEEAEKNNK